MSWTRSGKIWRCTEYSDLTSWEINNLAEWGQPFSPYDPSVQFDHDFYDNQTDFAKVTVEMPQLEVMTNGYGKKLTATNFPIVNRFLNGDLTVPYGTYSFKDLVDLGVASKDDRRISGNVYLGGSNGFSSGNLSASEAAYVHGTVGAALMDGTKFEYSERLRRVDAELGAADDNWDFESSTIPDFIEVLVAIGVGPEPNNLEAPIRIRFRGPGRHSIVERPIEEPVESAPEGKHGTPDPDAGVPSTPQPSTAGDAGLSPEHGTADGSFSAPHPVRQERPILVGPATKDQRNAVRPDLPIVACWRLNDIRFDFDSCFVRPEAHNDFRLLAALRGNHPGAVISIFGHADPVGKDGYNKQLSGRRALAVYAVLIRDVSRWETLWGQDNWGKSQVLLMLDALGYSPTENDGLHTGGASDALKAFQRDNRPLTAHGYINAATRKKLFKAYMDRLCGPNLELDKTADFLARGSDANRRGDVQGCSEFNPLLVLSESEDAELSQPAKHELRNAANVPNRRVLIFLFREGTRVDPADWPCPKADTTAIPACEARFHSDGRARLKNGPERRYYARAHKTFACRFYDRLSNFSPCENPGDAWVLRILAAGRGSIPNHKPLANEPFTLEGTGSGAVIRGRTDERGFLRASVVADTPTMTLKLAGTTITLNGGALHQMVDDNAVKDRLYNLGYGDADYDAWTDQTLTDAIKAFQKDHQLNDSGVADDGTRQRIKEMHGS